MGYHADIEVETIDETRPDTGQEAAAPAAGTGQPRFDSAAAGTPGGTGALAGSIAVAAHYGAWSADTGRTTLSNARPSRTWPNTSAAGRAASCTWTYSPTAESAGPIQSAAGDREPAGFGRLPTQCCQEPRDLCPATRTADATATHS